MRLIGYIRVSTRGQAEDGLGLEMQVTAIEAHCATGGHELVALHRDEGVSGTTEVIDRPGLSVALQAIVAGGAEGLIVYRLDRLARSLWLQEVVIAQLGKAGRVVLSTAEADIDSDDPTRILVRQVLGAIAQYERAIITARLQGGRRAKAAKGGYAYGSPGFGWRATPERELAAAPAEQRALARMVELVQCDPRPSWREIARTLEAEGFRPKRSDSWHPAVVRRIVLRALPQAAA